MVASFESHSTGVEARSQRSWISRSCSASSSGTRSAVSVESWSLRITKESARGTAIKKSGRLGKAQEQRFPRVQVKPDDEEQGERDDDQRSRDAGASPG